MKKLLLLLLITSPLIAMNSRSCLKPHELNIEYCTQSESDSLPPAHPQENKYAILEVEKNVKKLGSAVQAFGDETNKIICHQDALESFANDEARKSHVEFDTLARQYAELEAKVKNHQDAMDETKQSLKKGAEAIQSLKKENNCLKWAVVGVSVTATAAIAYLGYVSSSMSADLQRLSADMAKTKEEFNEGKWMPDCPGLPTAVLPTDVVTWSALVKYMAVNNGEIYNAINKNNGQIYNDMNHLAAGLHKVNKTVATLETSVNANAAGLDKVNKTVATLGTSVNVNDKNTIRFERRPDGTVVAVYIDNEGNTCKKSIDLVQEKTYFGGYKTRHLK